MVSLVCPELQVPLDTMMTNTIPLMTQVCSGRENIGHDFSRDILREVTGPSPAAEKSLKVIRSCLLLSFCWTLLELYNRYKDGGTQESTEEANSNQDAN